ncbi:MAG TPA: hypothetical protein VH593_15990 [Ktedonobacteraceae bacterium]
MAVFAQILTHERILTAIAERVRFTRARFGRYDLLDFVAVVIGYAVSGEPTLLTFYERLASFAHVMRNELSSSNWTGSPRTRCKPEESVRGRGC